MSFLQFSYQERCKAWLLINWSRFSPAASRGDWLWHRDTEPAEDIDLMTINLSELSMLNVSQAESDEDGSGTWWEISPEHLKVRQPYSARGTAHTGGRRWETYSYLNSHCRVLKAAISNYCDFSVSLRDFPKWRLSTFPNVIIPHRSEIHPVSNVTIISVWEAVKKKERKAACQTLYRSFSLHFSSPDLVNKPSL